MPAMLAAFTTVLLAVSTMEVWTTSVLNPMAGDNRLHPTAAPEARILAARGEREGFFLFVQAGRKGLANLTIEADPPGGGLPEPAVFRVGFVELGSPADAGPRAVAPDPLLPPHPTGLEPDEIAVYYVEYEVPVDAPPGIHRAELRVSSDGRRTRAVPVRIEILNFTLPEVPSLQAVAPLNRDTICQTYGMANRDLAAWQPVYDALAPWRVAYPVWAGGDLVTMDRSEQADATAFKEHLAHAVDKSRMSAIDLGGHGRGMPLFPPPLPGQEHDALHGYLDEMAGWLAERGWGARAYMAVLPAPQRDFWQPARAAYFRVWRARARVPRLLIQPLHPFWQHYTDIWAAPFLAYPPEMAGALARGEGVAQYEPADVAVRASDSGVHRDFRTGTRPEDAVDGSTVTAWYPNEDPNRSGPPWLEFVFPEPRTLAHITVVWAGAEMLSDLRAVTSYDGAQYASAAVSWAIERTAGPYVHSVSRGALRYPKPVIGLRIEFHGANPARAGVAEVAFAAAPEPARRRSIPPVRPWLHVRAGNFPGPLPGAHPAEMRLLPWVCHAHELRGFVLPGLAEWPPAWRALAQDPPLHWPAAANAGAALFYPGSAAPAPSLRMVRLRDGMEDYEYLHALAQAVAGGGIEEEAARGAVRLQLYGPDPTQEELETLAQAIPGTRLAIARLLEELPPAD